MHFLNPSSGWIYSKPRYTPSRDAIFDIRWVALRWVVVAENPGAFLSRYVVIHGNVGYIATIRDGRHLPLGPNGIRSFDSYTRKKNFISKKRDRKKKHIYNRHRDRGGILGGYVSISNSFAWKTPCCSWCFSEVDKDGLEPNGDYVSLPAHRRPGCRLTSIERKEKKQI